MPFDPFFNSGASAAGEEPPTEHFEPLYEFAFFVTGEKEGSLFEVVQVQNAGDSKPQNFDTRQFRLCNSFPATRSFTEVRMDSGIAGTSNRNLFTYLNMLVDAFFLQPGHNLEERRFILRWYTITSFLSGLYNS